MKKNRKQSESYRFNGHPSLSANSIRSIQIDDLVIEIGKLQQKLADPKDKDDKRWTATWLRRYEKELAKKRRGLRAKRRESQKETSGSRSSRRVGLTNVGTLRASLQKLA